MKRQLCLSLTWLLLVLTAWAASVRLHINEGFLTPKEEARLLRVINYMATFYRSYGLRSTELIQLRLYPTAADYEAYRVEINDTGVSPFGFLMRENNQIVTWRSEKWERVLLHEAHHAVLNTATRRPPQWYDEGMAEVFSTMDPDDPGLKVSLNVDEANRLRQIPADARGREILTVLQPTRGQYSLANYARAWALCHFLWTRPQGDQMVGKIALETVTMRDSRKVVDRCYPGGLADLEKDLQAFYRSF